MEYAMKFRDSYTVPGLAVGLAAGLGLIAGAPAHAQTVPAGTVIQPMQIVQPVQMVQTTETIRTIRPAPHAARRQVVTTRTITQRVEPTPTMVARGITTVPQPLYDVAPLTGSDDVYGSPRLYDTASPAPDVAPAPGGYTGPFIYRYVYEPSRILVIDPNTGVAVQAIPR
jgi:hypothetical protein